MSSFIEFTNLFKGNPTDSIVINMDHIISIFPSLKLNEETNEMKPVTILWADNNRNWEVEDSFEDVMKKINSKPIQDGMNTHFKRVVKDSKKIDDLTKT